MVGLEVGGLVGDQRVGRGVGFVEAVAGELGDQLEDAACIGLRHLVGQRALDEGLPLGVHLRLDLLAHGAAQQVGAAQAVVGEDLGNLHHLLLVDDDAKSLVEDTFEHRVQVVGLLAAVLAGDVAGNVVHRAGAVEGDQRDDVLDAVGLEAAERVPHARAFQLEHAGRSTTPQHLVGRPVVERQSGKVDLDPCLAQHGARVVEHGERLQPQQVELHEAGHLGVLHRELGRRHLRARIAVERNQLAERPVADDDARGMGGGVAVQPFELERYLDQAGDGRIVVALGRKPGLGVERLLQRHRVGRIVGDQLAQAVDAAVAKAEHAADIAEHGAGLELAEGDDLGDAVLAVAPAHVVDHLVAALRAEVDVEVRHRDPLGIEEALEQEAEAQRIEIGDGERPRHHGARARAAAGADRDPLPPRPSARCRPR